MKEIVRKYSILLDNTLRELAQIPGWTGGERRRAEWCRDFLLRAGYTDVTIDAQDSVIASYGIKPGKDNVAMMAHLDTVFSPEDDFTIREEDGKLYCPGIGDNTANAAGLLVLAAYLADTKPGTEKGIFFVFSSGEEGLGNLRGCRGFMERFGDRIGSCVALDLYYKDLFKTCVGSVRYLVRAKTQGGHSYLDFGHKNAISVLADIIIEVENNDVYNMDGLTYNVGTIRGGTSINVIAAEAEMLFEFRSEDSYKMKRADRAFRAFVEACHTEETQMELEILGLRPCGEAVDEDEMDCMVRSVFIAAEKSRLPMPIIGAASTDCNIPFSMGIPAICFGICMGGGAHTKGEWIEDGSLQKGFELLLNFFYAYLQ